MPIRCTFSLNGKNSSELYCSGFGAVRAFSGNGPGLDNPAAVAIRNVGPIPPGIYYIIDRQSGGIAGWLWDSVGASLRLTTDHTNWFALWNAKTGDQTIIHGIYRGNFRLHPAGPRNTSDGCIVVSSFVEFDRLATHIRARPPSIVVPGAPVNAYCTLEVR